MANLDIPSNMILRGEVYYVRMMIKGRDRWISTNQRALKSAMRRADEIKVKLRDGTFDKHATTAPTLQDWWKDYYDAYSSSKASPVSDVMAMKRVLGDLGRFTLDTIRPEQVRRALLKLRRTKAAMTVNATHSILHNVFKRAIENGIIPGPNPVTGIAYHKVVVRERVLTAEEQDKLLAILPATYQRWTLLVLSTGLRVSEARNIQPQQVDWDSQTIRVVGKRSKMRHVPLLGAAPEVLKDEWAASGRWWPFHRTVFRNMLRKGARDAHIPHLTPHTLRHTFATRYMQGGGDIFRLSKILGHTSVSITERVYVHLVKEDLVKGSRGIDLGVPTHKAGAQVVTGTFGTL